MEHETVKDALKDLIDLKNGEGLKVNGHLANGQEAQEYAVEIGINIADLLGMSELYMNNGEV